MENGTALTAEMVKRIKSALAETVRMSEKFEAKRIYANPEGAVEIAYNNEVQTLRAFYRKHICYLNHMLTTGVWLEAETELGLY